MTGYRVVNLKILIEELGEDTAKSILSDFSCPLNPDVEFFLSKKAIEFAKHGWSQTHLVFASYKGEWVLVGYFALSSKYIRISAKYLGNASSSLRRRISQFATYDRALKCYFLAAPLIAQLGKNYNNGYDKLITGDELLSEACFKIARLQFEIGGKFAYIECEDKPQLTDFYSRNGFCEFDTRQLDRDEEDKLEGRYLVQMLKYIK
jgi:hypothetical protein